MTNIISTEPSEIENKNKPILDLNNVYSVVRHPNNNCMSYIEHVELSCFLSYKFLVGSIKALVHAIIPEVYITSSGDTAKEVLKKMKESGCKKKKLKKK